MGLSNLLGPGATIFASLFAGTAGLWIGTRLTLGRFKHERAFERRVDWYERMIRSTQQMRAIAWEIVSTLSKLPPKRYKELSERAKQLAREFNDLADERHIYAKQAAQEAIRSLTLTTFSLGGETPEQQSGRRASNFWQKQHAEWSNAHRIVSEELQEVLFLKERRFFGLVRRERGDASRGTHSAGRQKVSVDRPQLLRRWLGLSNVKKKPAVANAVGKQVESPPMLPQKDGSDDIDEAGMRAVIDGLLATMQVRSRLEQTGDVPRVAILNVVQCGILRVADLRSLLALLNRLRGGKQPTEGWQRQHIARLLSLAMSENAEQFHFLLNPDLRDHVATLGGSKALRQFEDVLRDLQRFRGENTIKLQPFRNSIMAQRYANANLHLEALQTVSVAEIERLGYEQLNWITCLLGLVTGLWREARP